MMVFTLGIFAVLSLFGLVSYTGAVLESKGAVNHMLAAEAMYQAEAGVKLAKSTVEKRLAGGMSLEDALHELAIAPPEGYSFDPIQDFHILVPNQIFGFTSVGRSGKGAASISTYFRRARTFNTGIFGVESLTTKPNLSLYGYDSRTVTAPAPADSNGMATIGSNEDISLGNNNVIDGMVVLGESESEIPASCSGCEQYTTLEMGHQDPDPLGITGGQMAEEFAFYAIAANNDNASVPAIINNRLRLARGQNTTLTSGNYYLTDLNINNSNVLTIDDSDGPVRIFLNGAFYIGPRSEVRVDQPSSLQLYRNSSSDIVIQPNNSVSMVVYAPNAEVTVQPNGDFRGIAWGREMDLKPNTYLYVDTSLLDRFLKNSLVVHTWNEQRSP
jgi:hypothetical protein